MTYKEATRIVEEYKDIHIGRKGLHDSRVKEALQMAVDLLWERASIEGCMEVVKKGNSIWFVDFEEREIEEAIVHNVWYKNGRIEGFSVYFKASGDFDEFIGDAIGDNFFISEEMAIHALANGRGMKG